MKLKIRLLFVGFIISFLLVASLAAISFTRTARLNERISLVEHSRYITKTLDDIGNQLFDIEKASFRFLVTKDSIHLGLFDSSERALQLSLTTLRQLVSGNQRETDDLVLLESDIALYKRECREQMNHVLPKFTETSYYTDFLRNTELSKATKKLDEMDAYERKLLQERTEERKSDLQLTTSLIRTLSIVFSALTLLLFFLLLKEFRQRVGYQAELQQRLTEIAQSKRELEHIAYATSHDLQEPLRKIRIFTDKWYSQHKNELAPESKGTIERVMKAALRMQELVSELMALASLNADIKKVACPVELAVDAAMQQLKDAVSSKSAVVEIDELPIVHGYPEQLKVLFRNLIDNALKFSKNDEQARISISSRRADSSELSDQHESGVSYYCITVTDNGIGFDNKQVDKIFGIFRQLHTNREGYVGKGTGLAICQRIMTNHRGYIIAHGFPGEGATFKLYFPVAA